MQGVETYCLATMNYMGGLQTVAVEVDIRNGRQAVDLRWQKNGFELIDSTSGVTDWRDDSEIVRTYYPEMAALAQSLSGCDHALVAGHISRNPEQAALHQDYAPIEFVHSDFTDNYGQLLIERYRKKPEEVASALSAAGLTVEDMARARRILILQFWRNVGPEQMDYPLAFCDAQSVPRADMHAIHVPNYAGGDFAFDTYAVTPPPAQGAHAWYVFPNMTRDEAVAFRTFDSEMAARGEAYWTPHSAFLDPTVDDSTPARRSIEVRATCLFF
ncbi:MAG: CmcJ/NvfI family oxidoreductase [bacterium]